MAIWGIFLHTTLRAAVHLGQDYEANLRYANNHFWNSVGQLFNENEKLIGEQKRNHWCKHSWMSTSLLCSKASQITNAKTYVFSEMIILRPGRAKLNNHFKDMNRIDGMPTEFEWKIFLGITTLGLLEKIQSLMRDLQCEPEHFKDKIIFVSMYNDIAWGEKREYRKM